MPLSNRRRLPAAEPRQKAMPSRRAHQRRAQSLFSSRGANRNLSRGTQRVVEKTGIYALHTQMARGLSDASEYSLFSTGYTGGIT